eukprot:gnl/TRDRNA2_/TRDRNA2_149898_c0_seq1.p1 gnl/TRDRNA2_/TRDRNA2_149898_c0~~gnl/TRDRNA2_/TRDRNA2_149898_c0_seq1.p1  ORF type:complete len:120 (+),score=11.85 gnl/TRDRNA2_/TRDRNA2_149898_c0_seq1:51-362(+)
MDHGDRWIKHMKEAIQNESNFYVDANIPFVLEWVKGAALRSTEKMQPFGPNEARCSGQDWDRHEEREGSCHKTQGCLCAQDPLPVSWHIKGDFEFGLRLLADT